MSGDFIDGLHTDLVEAMERHERRGRLAAAVSPPRPRPATLVRFAAAAAAAAIVAAVVAIVGLAPAPRPARPQVVSTLDIGGTPIDAAVADGSLWVSDFTGSVVRVDPVGRRIIARIKVSGAPGPVTTGEGSVWVQSAGKHCEGRLLRIDASSGRIVARTPRAYPFDGEGVGALAFGGGGIWARRGCALGHEGIDRLDPTGVVTGGVTVPAAEGLAAAGRNLWVLGHDGTLTLIDASSGRVRQRWPRLAPLSDLETNNTKALAAVRAGVWVLSTGRQALLRIQQGRVVRRLPVPGSARPLLARTQDGFWIATADRPGADNRLIRINAYTGSTTATLKLGARQPVALVPTGGQLCVLTGDGRILFVRP
jgi:outer membrane protein assembly factor BamB